VRLAGGLARNDFFTSSEVGGLYKMAFTGQAVRRAGLLTQEIGG